MSTTNAPEPQVAETPPNPFAPAPALAPAYQPPRAYHVAAQELGLASQRMRNPRWRQAFAPVEQQEYRLNNLGELENVCLVNDAYASSVRSTYFALHRTQGPIVWIAGGQDRARGDYGLLNELVAQKVVALVTIGKDGQQMQRYFAPHGLKGCQERNLHEALNRAFGLAKAAANDSPTGMATILFSPACASFDLFENRQQRGDVFVAEVKELVERIRG